MTIDPINLSAASVARGDFTLGLDHKNGRDHRPENLRWVCPNCDSQSDTFCGRNNRAK